MYKMKKNISKSTIFPENLIVVHISVFKFISNKVFTIHSLNNDLTMFLLLEISMELNVMFF